MPLFAPCIGGVGRSACGVGVDRETGARALAFRIGDAGKRLLQTVAGAHATTGKSITS